MLRIPEILRAYSALTTFTKARSPYVPHLELFEKRGSTVKLDILSNPSKSRNSLMPSNQDSVLLAVPSQRE